MHAIEWAEFSLRPGVTPTELVAAAVAMQRQFLDNQRGYVSRQLLAIGPDRYADLVTWRTRDAADAAIARAAEYAACRNYFALLYVDKQPVHGIPLFAHGTAAAAPSGMEFSLFRLRPGVDETGLAKAAREMAAELYAGEPGFETHLIMRSADDPHLFADVILAESAERARALCGKWGEGPFHPACTEYLQLIEPESVRLQFWQQVA